MTVDLADVNGAHLHARCCQCQCYITRYGTYDWQCNAGHQCTMLGCIEHKPHHTHPFPENS
jgi:hypothetical protein